jgi:hypothetical protein
MKAIATSAYDPAVIPEPAQPFETLPPQLDSAQVRAWFGLSKEQWRVVRHKRAVRAAEVFGAAGPALRFWTCRLAHLLPRPEEMQPKAQMVTA